MKKFKSQASSSRAAPAFGGGFGVSSGSSLSYIAEPPDLTPISDGNVVVAFKNLAKKDGTTKAKGLEDLLAYAQAHPNEQGGTEDAILEAWVKLYPRVSIDNSRRVRELSHKLQFELLKSARKRMERHIPQLVGAWLGGTYDRDTIVSRAATTSVTSFLDTDEKYRMFWRRCQAQTLEFAQLAVEETVETLSDERTVSPDDAAAKYDRVMGASLSLVMNLLKNLSQADLQKESERYAEYFGNKKVWGLIASNDPFVRRTCAQLIEVALDTQRDLVADNIGNIGTAFVADGLRAHQSGSALAFVQALTKLTASFPEIWIKSQKRALSRLRRFVEKGSQSGPPEFWPMFKALVLQLPAEVLPADADGSIELLHSMRDGISQRGESRLNVAAAWMSYFDIAEQLGDFTDPSAKDRFLTLSVYPFFEQYLRPSHEMPTWTSGGNLQSLAKAFQVCLDCDTFLVEWTRLSKKLSQSLQMSLPEQSKDYIKTQDALVSECQRWVDLSSQILKSEFDDRTLKIIAPSLEDIISDAIDVLSRRNGKPYAAAALLKFVLEGLADLIRQLQHTMDAIAAFMKDQVPNLVESPSSSYLISSLHLFSTLPGQAETCQRTWRNAVDHLGAETSAQIARDLIASTAIEEAVQQESKLQAYLLTAIISTARGQTEQWFLLDAALVFNSLQESNWNSLVSKLIDDLDAGNPSLDQTLRALETIAAKKPRLLGGSGNDVLIISKLLALTEVSESDQTTRVMSLKRRIEGLKTNSEEQSPMLRIIQDNLCSADTHSLSIQTLIEQAAILSTVSDTITLFPTTTTWAAELAKLDRLPNRAISITNPLHGAVAVVDAQPHSKILARDVDGFSIPLRMAMYTRRLLDTELSLPVELAADYLFLLCLTTELANDQMGLQDKNLLWLSIDDAEGEAEIQNFLSSSQAGLAKVLAEAHDWRNEDSVVGVLLKKLLCSSQGLGTQSFYAARALSSILGILAELHGWQTAGGDDWLAQLNVLSPSTPQVFAATAVLTGLQESLLGSKLVSNLCNRLISEMADASASGPKTLGLLAMLNACLKVYDDSIPVAQNRLVFAVRQITSWLDGETLPPWPVAFEACRALVHLLPAIKGVYGGHWEAAIKYCIKIWSDDFEELDQSLPEIYATLRLVATLESLAAEGDEDERNDDLADTIESMRKDLKRGTINLLKIPREKETQPLLIVDQMLYRRATELDIVGLDLQEIYPLLASGSKLVQLAGFEVLHRAIPAAQEQISLDAVLEKKDARISDELLSLLLDVPTLEAFSQAGDSFPASVRGYLLSVHLVFDSYKNASYKVRTDYTENLKTENYVSPFLDLMADILGHSAGRPINLTRANFNEGHIASYDAREAESELDGRNMQWLLIHLYYLCLARTPQLVKSWWLALRSKQTRIAIESWTESYFSPLVIAEALRDVQTWGDSQEEATDDEKQLTVKVSPKSREVYAGYEIDETQLKLVVRLPPAYPLEGVRVENVNRVAVSESKWQSWMMITQGVITFSNSIIDGLAVFRKNVIGALKGQTECAICYSIISADRKVPDKRCQTCKNLFHSSCLFKWFSTSNQSSCPLCRNPFQYADPGRRRAAASALD